MYVYIYIYICIYSNPHEAEGEVQVQRHEGLAPRRDLVRREAVLRLGWLKIA